VKLTITAADAEDHDWEVDLEGDDPESFSVEAAVRADGFELEAGDEGTLEDAVVGLLFDDLDAWTEAVLQAFIVADEGARDEDADRRCDEMRGK
jgi:hypothetical protein